MIPVVIADRNRGAQCQGLAHNEQAHERAGVDQRRSLPFRIGGFQRLDVTGFDRAGHISSGVIILHVAWASPYGEGELMRLSLPRLL